MKSRIQNRKLKNAMSLSFIMSSFLILYLIYLSRNAADANSTITPKKEVLVLIFIGIFTGLFTSSFANYLQCDIEC